MKSNKLLLLVLLSIGLVSSVFLFGYPSWSQSDGSSFEPFLKITLSMIVLSLWTLSYTHELASKELLKVKGVTLRLRHLDRIAAFSFVGVLAVGVNEIWYLHDLFIAFAAFVMFIRITKYYDNDLYELIAKVFLIVAGGIWLLGLLPFIPWNIGIGETIFYLGCMFSIFTQFDKIK